MIVLTAGRFGEAVGKRMKSAGAAVYSLTEPQHDFGELIANAAFVGVALWRPYVDLCDWIDELCFRSGVRWSPAVMDSQLLTCGPWIMPGHGPCYKCYRKRYLTHLRGLAEREKVLRDAYRRDHSLGPSGYIEPLVTTASGALHAAAGASVASAGEVRSVDGVHGTVQETSVIAVHNCDRCRNAEGRDVSRRFVERMVPAVEEILR